MRLPGTAPVGPVNGFSALGIVARCPFSAALMGCCSTFQLVADGGRGASQCLCNSSIGQFLSLESLNCTSLFYNQSFIFLITNQQKLVQKKSLYQFLWVSY